jgi:hypothetical protein
MKKSKDELEQVKEWIRKILSLLDEDSELRTLAGQLVHKVTSIDIPERSALRKEIQLKKSEGKEVDTAMIGPAPPGRRRAKAAPEVSAAFDPFEIYKTFGREELKERLTQLTQKDVKIIIQKYVVNGQVKWDQVRPSKRDPPG